MTIVAGEDILSSSLSLSSVPGTGKAYNVSCDIIKDPKIQACFDVRIRMSDTSHDLKTSNRDCRRESTIRSTRHKSLTFCSSLLIIQIIKSIIIIMASRGTGCVHSGWLCCYDGCDFENILCGCVGSHDCLCLRYSDCCAIGIPPRLCGISANKGDELLKIGCFCVECGIIVPYTLCAAARKHCCCFV